MIESQTELPLQEGEPSTIWARSGEALLLMVARFLALVQAWPRSRMAAWLGRMATAVRCLVARVRWHECGARVVSRLRHMSGDSPLLSRLALHLVVVLLAVGAVAVSQITIPAIDFSLPTPTPGPDLGARTVTTPASNRGVGRFTDTTAALFPAPVPHTTIPERERVDVITYTVQPNDNLWVIAQGFKLQVETIAWANPEVEQAPDLLSVGQQLVILPLDGIYYTVKAGDTLGKLAKDFQTTVDKISSFKGNALTDPYTLVAGQKLILPGGRKQTPKWQTIYPMTWVGSPPKGAATGTGRFAWPARGLLTQRFWSAHAGIDIANSVGTPIYAADAGYVRMAGRDTYGYGNQVVIDHGNGFYTRYAHLHTILVKAGQSVERNQKIATMGNTGRSTGPHLHFEIILNGVPRNPQGYLP